MCRAQCALRQFGRDLVLPPHGAGATLGAVHQSQLGGADVCISTWAVTAFPWIRGRWLSSDPTPGDAVGLRLMALDRMPSVLFWPALLPWQRTGGNLRSGDLDTARYSQLVVESLYQAVRLLLAEGGYSELVLIGYSGGGALAMLLAPCFRKPLR